MIFVIVDMLKYFSKILFPVFFLTIMIVSCSRSDKFDDRPYIEYESYRLIVDDTTNRKSIEFSLYFTDGDGDLGSDETPPADCDFSLNNLFVSYFEKVDGIFTEVLPVDSCLTFDSQIPNITPEGSNPTLEGTINTRFDYSGFPANSGVDSVKFEFMLRDRSGKESNIAVSPAIATPQD